MMIRITEEEANFPPAIDFFNLRRKKDRFKNKLKKRWYNDQSSFSSFKIHSEKGRREHIGAPDAGEFSSSLFFPSSFFLLKAKTPFMWPDFNDA